MKYKIWHNPQVPGPTFYAQVPTRAEAARCLQLLAAYDLFQCQHNIRGDFSNASGLLVYEHGEWTEWCTANGDDIWDVIRHRHVEAQP